MMFVRPIHYQSPEEADQSGHPLYLTGNTKADLQLLHAQSSLFHF
jgi:hypothetical protein